MVCDVCAVTVRRRWIKCFVWIHVHDCIQFTFAFLLWFLVAWAKKTCYHPFCSQYSDKKSWSTLASAEQSCHRRTDYDLQPQCWTRNTRGGTDSGCTSFFRKDVNMVPTSTTTWYTNFNSMIRFSLGMGRTPGKMLWWWWNFSGPPIHHCVFALKYHSIEWSKSYACGHKTQTHCKHKKLMESGTLDFYYHGFADYCKCIACICKRINVFALWFAFDSDLLCINLHRPMWVLWDLGGY